MPRRLSPERQWPEQINKRLHAEYYNFYTFAQQTTFYETNCKQTHNHLFRIDIDRGGESNNLIESMQASKPRKAKEVMCDHPDSALHILESMETPSPRADKESYAPWRLLTSQDKVKLIMKTPSDSLVKIAYHYYKPTDNNMSALYTGNINYALGNIEETQRRLFIIIVCLIIAVAVVVCLYQKRLVRKETTIRKQSELLQTYRLQFLEYETSFMRNNRYMGELEARQSDHTKKINSYHEQINSLQTENGRLSEKIAALQQHIAEYTSKLDNARKETERFREITEENLNLKQRGQMLSDYVAGSHKLVKELKGRSRFLEDSEWESLAEMCEGAYGKFVTRLKEVCPTLTKQELYLCILIKLRFSHTQMSEIFGVSTASVSQKKFRLKKHLNESVKDGLTDETTLDRWVAEF